MMGYYVYSLTFSSWKIYKIKYIFNSPLNTICCEYNNKCFIIKGNVVHKIFLVLFILQIIGKIPFSIFSIFLKEIENYINKNYHQIIKYVEEIQGFIRELLSEGFRVISQLKQGQLKSPNEIKFELRILSENHLGLSFKVLLVQDF